MAQAKSRGYRLYLYYVCIEPPQLNRERVQDRVRKGGHDVPEEKIQARYRSLGNLYSLTKMCDRSYFFDNSTNRMEWIAELDGGKFTPRQGNAPKWFAE